MSIDSIINKVFGYGAADNMRQGDFMTDPIYEAHRAKHVEAYNYHPSKDVQGEFIEWMKEYSAIEISREDFTSMNCGVTTDLIEVCNYISECEHIKFHKTYLALCAKGRAQCYHQMKVNHRDIFTDIETQVSRCKRAIDSPSKRAAARATFTIFNDVHSVKYHTDRQTLKIVVEESAKCGVRTSHLNLYWTLTGLEYLVANEYKYQMLADTSLFVDALYPLKKANIFLNEKLELLNAWMAI